MITYHKDLEQNTPEWYEHRLGVITASRVKDLLTGTFKLSKDKKIKMFAYELASQRITKRVEEGFQSWDMKRGHIEEEIAKKLYSENYHAVHDCGFITNDELGFTLGFSPDGLVGDDGIIEIKSRQPKFQIKTICASKTPDEYMVQCQTGLFATDRKWCDFIQYSNGLPLFVERVYPDPELQDTIKIATKLFEDDIQHLVEEFTRHSEGLVESEYVDHACEQAISDFEAGDEF